MGIGIGSIVVYNPFGEPVSTEMPRLIVVSVPDDANFVWCVDIVLDTLTKPDILAKYVGDLTQLA